MNYQTRVKIEKTIVKKIVGSAIANGYKVSVWDGDEWACRFETDNGAIMASLFHTDIEHIHIDDSNCQTVGRICLVYGNNGYDVVADHTDSSRIDEILESANAYAEQMELLLG